MAQASLVTPFGVPGRVAGYGRPAFRKDLVAGITVAAISLPQAMAYALIAGVDPRFGLYSSIVVTAVASIFGSSSHLVNGPTNAISLVVFSALAFIDPEARLEAYQAMFLLGIMVGALQIVIAVLKLGDLTRFISEAVVLGFMAGAGLLVALGQVNNLLGIADKGTGHQLVVHRIYLSLTSGAAGNPRAVAVGLGTMAMAVVFRRLLTRFALPRVDMLAALVVAALLAAKLGWSSTGSGGKAAIAVLGRVPRSFPTPHVPEIEFAWVRELGGSAVAIAVLGLLEALAIAKSIANDTRQVLDYNRQCLAEGIANLTGGFFQCLPGSGSLTRSAINHQAGAVSRFSGVIAAAAVALVLATLAPLARYVPKAALAGLLMVTAARLIDWRRLVYALRASRFDAGLVAVTAVTAVFVSVEFSILIGVALSILLFVPRAARLKARELAVSGDRVIRGRLAGDHACSSIVIYDLEGELFFGAAPELERYLDELRARVRQGAQAVILRLQRTRNPDLVCLERLEHFLRDVQQMGGIALLAGVGDDVRRTTENLRFYDWFPRERAFAVEPDAPGSSTIKALREAHRLLGQERPLTCDHCRALHPEAGDIYYAV
jgi:SulP family sulfate permease